MTVSEVRGFGRPQRIEDGHVQAAFHVGIETDEVSATEEKVDVVQKPGDGGYVDGMSE